MTTVKPKHKWVVKGTSLGEEKYFDIKSDAISHIKRKLLQGYSRIWLEVSAPGLYDPAGPEWVSFKKYELWELVNKKPKMTRKVK